MTHTKKILLHTLLSWLPLAATIIILSALVYGAVQQSYRQSANDPQIQIAEDISAAIENGTKAENVAPETGTTDVRKSLSPFVLIFDDSGKLLGSTAILDGKNPSFPTSVFDFVKNHGTDTVTWQPAKDVRISAVVVRYSGQESGYVVAGKSLREVKKRINHLGLMTLIAMLAALVLSFLLKLLATKKHFSHEHHEHAEIVFDSTKE